MALFCQGDFVLHGGQPSWWKVACEALLPEDWATLARLVASRYAFTTVLGIPRGGLALAEALRPLATPDGPYRLIVDDVLTTGGSMWTARQALPPGPGATRDGVLGIVVFARGVVAPWIRPLWQWGLDL